MKKLDCLLKGFKKDIEENFVDRADIAKEIKLLENERFKLMNQKIDDLYGDYSKDYKINVINIQLDVLYHVLEEM